MASVPPPAPSKPGIHFLVKALSAFFFWSSLLLLAKFRNFHRYMSPDLKNITYNLARSTGTEFCYRPRKPLTHLLLSPSSIAWSQRTLGGKQAHRATHRTTCPWSCNFLWRWEISVAL